MSDARTQAERVCCWVKANPKAFKFFMATAHRFADEGKRLTRSRAYAIAEVEGVKIADDDGSPAEHDITRNHNFWPCITRLMTMLRPRFAKCFEFRKSMFDDIDLADVWHDNVNAGTTFLASSRKEAQHLVEIGDVGAR